MGDRGAILLVLGLVFVITVIHRVVMKLNERGWFDE